MSDSDLVQELFDNFSVSPFQGPRVNMTPQELAAFDPLGNPQPTGWIDAGAIDSIASFAATIRPVFLVTALPALPDANYPVGQFVYKTNDVPPRLYKNVANAWVAAVGPDDIQADSITAGQIAAGAISASEIAANAVVASKMAAGSVNIGHMTGSPSNLVSNPSLEFDAASFPPTGWGPKSDGVPVTQNGANFTIDPAIGHSGTKSLLHTQPNPVAANSQDSWAFPVIGGRRYRWSFWFRGDAANGTTARARLNVRFFDAAGAVLSNTAVYNLANSPGNNTAWQQASGTIVADATAVYASVRANSTTTGATIGDKIYWDDFEFYPADYDVDHAAGDVKIDSTGVTINGGKLIVKDSVSATTITGGVVQAAGIAAAAVSISKLRDAVDNLAPNPGFEADGDTTAPAAITGWVPTTGDENQWATQATFRSGAYGLGGTQKGTPEAINIDSEFIPVEAGAVYIRRVWVRGITGNGAAAAGLWRHIWYDVNKSLISSGSASQTVGASGTWVAIQGTATAPTNAAFMKIELEVTSATPASNVVVFDDVEFYRADHDVNHAAGTVLINSTGVQITNGAISVQNAGSTVIIDGSSNMFKIAATGTMTRAWPTGAPASATTTVTLTALGSGFTTPPAHIANVRARGTAVTAIRDAQGYYALEDASGHFAGYGYVGVNLTASPGTPKVNLVAQNVNFDMSVFSDLQARYYVLIEAGI